MRIFQLNTFCGVKSTGRIASEIAKLVEREGGKCQIGYGVPGISIDSEAYAYRIGTPAERKIHGAFRKFLDAEGYGSYFATQKLIAEIKRFQPDLIHLHNLHGCYLHLKSLFTFLAQYNHPVVWTLHDCWPFTGHCAYFDYSGCEKWKTGCHHCPQQKSYPICLGLDGSERNYRNKRTYFTALSDFPSVAPCNWMNGPLSQSFFRQFPVRIIPNGVNLAVFHPTDSHLREKYHWIDRKICLSVASEWDERKGLSFLCQAAKKMGDSYQFVVIGLSADQIDHLPSGMLGLQHTSSTSELAAWYSAADCFVNPTLEDNMPMVNMEALACGTPVVVFDTGGCSEVVNEQCGKVVAQGDVSALCSAIIQVCHQKKAMRTACLQRASLFDCQRTFQSYVDLYKELLS